MRLGSFIMKTVVIGLLLKFTAGSIDDVITGLLNSISANAARMEMRQLHEKLMEFYHVKHRYPQSAEELFTFLEDEFDDPIEIVVTDPWQTEYIFLSKDFEIICFGPDKKRNTKDDLVTQYPKKINSP